MAAASSQRGGSGRKEDPSEERGSFFAGAAAWTGGVDGKEGPFPRRSREKGAEAEPSSLFRTGRQHLEG
uniref:Uncharacterized protein n=1 Tax=Oryza barthii TaxID=65489 RepID=A0A0D3FUP0_9ORYZ